MYTVDRRFLRGKPVRQRGGNQHASDVQGAHCPKSRGCHSEGHALVLGVGNEVRRHDAGGDATYTVGTGDLPVGDGAQGRGPERRFQRSVNSDGLGIGFSLRCLPVAVGQQSNVVGVVPQDPKDYRPHGIEEGAKAGTRSGADEDDEEATGYDYPAVVEGLPGVRRPLDRGLAGGFHTSLLSRAFP